MPGLISRWLFWLSLAFSVPIEAKNHAKLAIIIDDLGYNLSLGKRTVELPGAFTLAVLPFTPHSRELAELAHQRGKEVMLHLPMSNHHQYPLGQGGLTSNMEQTELLAALDRNLANVPYVKGVNNHMGSQLTEQTQSMRWLMRELQDRKLYFVDSRTSARTKAQAEAERINLPSRKRDLFLDNKRNSRAIEAQLTLALNKARQEGSAIAIGHPYPETLEVLQRIKTLLAKHNVELVPVSALVFDVNSVPSITYCAAPDASLWPTLRLPVDPFDEQILSLPQGSHTPVK